MKTKKQIEEEDEEFHKLYEEFLINRDKKIWDRMFQLVYETCESVIKKKCIGLTVPDFDGKVLETAMDVMKRLAKEIKQNKINLPKKLATLVYSYSLWALYNPANKFFERQISYEEYVSNNGDQDFD